MGKLLNRYFMPDIFADTVFDIDIELLAEKGIKAFVFDIDNTLATYAMPIADAETLSWIRNLKDGGFGVYFVSNNNRERVRIFSENAGVPYFARALKPRGKYLRRACSEMGVKPCETVLVGDQLFTDIMGGKRLKMLTVLVKPISDSEDWFVKLKRGIEARILAEIKSGSAKR